MVTDWWNAIPGGVEKFLVKVESTCQVGIFMEFYQRTIEVFGGGVTWGFDEKGVRDVVLDDSVCLVISLCPLPDIFWVRCDNSGNSCSSCRGGGARDSSRFGIGAKDYA